MKVSPYLQTFLRIEECFPPLPAALTKVLCRLCAGRSHQICSLFLSSMCFLAVIHSTGPDVIQTESVNVLCCLKVNMSRVFECHSIALV